MKLIELRNHAQATCLLDDEQTCSLWDTDEDKEEKPKKFPKLSRGDIEAKRKNISAMDIDVPDTDPVQTVRVLRPVQPRDNLFVEYTAESLGNALFFIRNAGFCELGANALSKEECWFTVMTEYSTTIKNVAAGLSQTFGEIIKLFFDSNGFDVGNAGISLPFEPEDIRLWAKVGVIIQDGSAHKYVWSSRGDAGSRICLLCKNLVSAASEMLDSDNTNLLRSNTIKLNELEASTDADLRANARHLEAHYGTMSKLLKARRSKEDTADFITARASLPSENVKAVVPAVINADAAHARASSDPTAAAMEHMKQEHIRAGGCWNDATQHLFNPTQGECRPLGL